MIISDLSSFLCIPSLIYGMKFVSLFGFVTVMWIMILAEVAFLVFPVPTLDRILLKNWYSRPIVSSDRNEVCQPFRVCYSDVDNDFGGSSIFSISCAYVGSYFT